MIQNLQELAAECGSSARDASRQWSDIAKAVLSHSEGLVRPWYMPDMTGLELRGKYGKTSLTFPFSSEDLWKDIEWLHGESLSDEDYYEDFPYQEGGW